MKKPAPKVAAPAQIQLKSQFLFHKNLPPRDFSIMTLKSGGQMELGLRVLYCQVESMVIVLYKFKGKNRFYLAVTHLMEITFTIGFQE